MKTLREESSVIEDLAAVRQGALTFDQTAIELATLYETKFGIFNHADPIARRARPLALVAVHPKEDSSRYSPLYNRISQYHRLKIRESFGITLTELLQMPRDYVEEIIRLAAQEAAQTGRQLTEVERGLSRAESELKDRKGHKG